ncbi:MAG: hypothetical protein QOD86_965 [Miltoncostaeaceae bacterium]|jgi:hypothetical protein|nr:hypothetical protein [Miltoncostaeaceae bacterium]
MGAITSRLAWLERTAGWAVGVPFAVWRYAAREVEVDRRLERHPWPIPGFPLEARAGRDVQGPGDGRGAAYLRRYRARVADPILTPEELMGVIANDPDVACPVEFARFERTGGEPGDLRPGDEFRVRLPGPWNGPVRVIEVDERSFRLATLRGHMEAGEIVFRASDEDGRLIFEIASWARSGDPLFALLYDHIPVNREIQQHMWVQFLLRVAQISGGRIEPPVEVHALRSDDHPFSRRRLGPARREKVARTRPG